MGKKEVQEMLREVRIFRKPEPIFSFLVFFLLKLSHGTKGEVCRSAYLSIRVKPMVLPEPRSHKQMGEDSSDITAQI